MKRSLAIVLLAVGMALQAESNTAIIHSQPLNAGRISPMLFGNFIELLDDVVPGMWAEMLGDRSFEGIGKLSPWCYYDGAPDLCDRAWNTNSGWSLDTQHPFNGAHCARIRSELTQSNLAVKKGMTYVFTGHFRAANSDGSATVTLKTQLPDGAWMTLASANLPRLSQVWQKCSVHLFSKGDTERAVFELRVKGQGDIWADKLSLMPADNESDWRRDVVDAIAAVHPALIRFGGSVCDPGEYRWKNGIGDRDLRVPFPNKVWGRLDPNDVGIDEFCQFCELTQAAPLICLSFSDGPQNAADLVEYCNGSVKTQWGARRAGNGHPTSYRVKYWQVGNEISGDDENYLSQFRRFVTLMKQTDPGVEILSSFPAKKLFDRVGKDVAFVAPHHYTPDLAGCEREFETLSRLIDQTPGCSQIKIAVTEWNTSGGDWGLGRAQFLTLDSALRNARYLHALMRHCDKTKIACRSNMANSFCGGIIETSPSGLLKRPSYYIMQLYAAHALPVPLKSEGGGDGLDVFSCGSEDGKKAVVFAVNYGRKPIPWSLKLDGEMTAVRAESVCDTQDTRQPDIENHWDALNRIRTVGIPVESNKITLPALSATAIECEVK